MIAKIFKFTSIIIILVLFRFGDENYVINETKYWNEILPQGWGFFTIPTHNANLYHYNIDVNNYLSSIKLNSSSATLLFGFDRANRRKSLAYNYVFSKPVQWKLKEVFLNIKDEFQKRDNVSFENRDSYLEKGFYVTVKKETLPLDKREITNPRKVIYFFEVK